MADHDRSHALFCAGAECVRANDWLHEKLPVARFFPTSLKNESCAYPVHTALDRILDAGGSCSTEAYSFSDKFPHETFDLSRLVDRIEDLPFAAALDWKGPESPSGEEPVPAEWQRLGARPGRLRNGWVPSLLQSLDVRLNANGSHQWRKYMRVDGALASAAKAHRGGPNPFHYPEHVLLPCSTARGEDALALRTFFADRETGRPIVHARTHHASIEPPLFLEIGGMTGHE